MIGVRDISVFEFFEVVGIVTQDVDSNDSEFPEDEPPQLTWDRFISFIDFFKMFVSKGIVGKGLLIWV